jgi:hypothetical protein
MLPFLHAMLSCLLFLARSPDRFSQQLVRAVWEFLKMKAHYLPSFPPRMPHNKCHAMFRGVQVANFDAHGRRWNGFLHGRKNADGTPNMTCEENYGVVRLERTTDVSSVIASLAEGFRTNCFVHLKKLDGPINFYSRASDFGDGGDSDADPVKTIWSINSKCCIAKADPKPLFIFALDCVLFGNDMLRNKEPFRMGAMGLVEAIPESDLRYIPYATERRIFLSETDQPHISGVQTVNRRGALYASFKGAVKDVISKELELRKALRVQRDVSLSTGQNKKFVKQMIEGNLQTLKDERHVFRPMKFAWSNMHDLEVRAFLPCAFARSG